MRSTVSVLRTGSVAVSVDSLCSVPVKTWRSLYSLCLSPNPATDRGWVAQPSVRPLLQAAFRCLGYCRSTRGTKGSPNGSSLAMYPSVGSASQAQRYVTKERRFLSDAPFGRFPEFLARRLSKICGGIFPSVFF